MGVFLLLPSPLVRYQPSGYSIILDPIFLKTVTLLLSLSLSLNPQSKFSCRLPPYSSFFTAPASMARLKTSCIRLYQPLTTSLD